MQFIMRKKDNFMRLKNQDRKEKGATMIEYALMIALIAIIAVVAITNIGTAANEAFRKVGNSLNTANN